MVDSVSDDIAAAQIQASATIVAADIQARATISAAWTQGWFTITGGLAVLLAAAVAFGAAKRQVRLVEVQARALAAAYQERLRVEIADLADIACVLITQIGIFSSKDMQSSAFIVRPIDVTLLGDSEWREHARFGKDVVSSVLKLQQAVKRLNGELGTCADGQGLNMPSTTADGVALTVGQDGNISFGQKTRGAVVIERSKHLIDICGDLSSSLGGGSFKVPPNYDVILERFLSTPRV